MDMKCTLMNQNKNYERTHSSSKKGEIEVLPDNGCYEQKYIQQSKKIIHKNI